VALLASVLIFVVVAITFMLLWLFAGSGSAQETVRRRMESVRKAERRGGRVSLGVELVRDEMLSSVPAIHRMLLQWSWPARLREYLNQAGLRIRPAKLVLICGVVALATNVLVGRFLPRFPISILFGLAAGMIPVGVVAWMRNRRFRQFEQHFPEALDLLGRAVRAGHAFTTGLEMIAKESPEPIAGEFRITFDEQNFGLPLRDALLNLTERVPLIDVRFFVTALLIQKETGGNLAEILDGLSHVIRDRFRIYRDVRTKTAQGKLTAGILIALPPFMMFVLSLVNPHYIGVLFTDPAGPTVLMVAATLQIIGSIILWKIIHIEV
jgi:tight adherence protein B